MSELMKAVAAAWNPEIACKKRVKDLIYIGDFVTVTKGRKLPKRKDGKMLKINKDRS